MRKFHPTSTIHNTASKNSHIQAAILSNKMSNVVRAGAFKKEQIAKTKKGA